MRNMCYNILMIERKNGLIPQVKELEDKYPMDKLYVFPKDIAEA